VFAAEGIGVVCTPYRAATANAYAERWVRSVPAECLDHLLVVNEAHLRHVLVGYVAHYNEARPHRGLGQQTPIPYARCVPRGPVRRRDVLGGLIHEYDRETA
jgi:putative transposase